VTMKRTKKAPRSFKPARSSRSKRAAVPAAANTSFAWMTTSRAIVSVMIFVVVAAAMLNAGGDDPRVDVERDHVLPVAMTVEHDTPRPVEATKTVVARPPAPVKPDPMTPTVVNAVEPQPQAAPAAASVATTTITGCLERDDEGAFRLTDASGADAPTARSWKSGFLKKRPAHIELADAVGTLNLRNHIGRRVAVNGALVDRELRAGSVRVVGPCE
jgi:hypothetical protein